MTAENRFDFAVTVNKGSEGSVFGVAIVNPSKLVLIIYGLPSVGFILPPSVPPLSSEWLKTTFSSPLEKIP